MTIEIFHNRLSANESPARNTDGKLDNGQWRLTGRQKPFDWRCKVHGSCRLKIERSYGSAHDLPEHPINRCSTDPELLCDFCGAQAVAFQPFDFVDVD